MKRLYVDFDGVILNTNPILYEEAKKSNYSKEDNEFYKNFDFKKVLKDEYILNDSINCLKKLIDSSKFEVNILTHCSSFNEGIDKISYIRKFFKEISVIICPKEVSKAKLIHSKDAILIDDYSGNLKEWEEEGGIPIRFSPELESKGFQVINRLDKLIEIF